MSSNQKTFLFAAVMCLVCGFMLTIAATSLKARQDHNSLVDEQKNIAKALGLLPEGKKLAANDIASIYQNQVVLKYMDAAGNLNSENGIPVYCVFKGDQLHRYAVPISGYGLWSTLYGYVALKGDGATISGMTFYKHGETPGLGGECEKPWFVNSFVGKRIIDREGNFVSVGLVKGKVTDKIPVQDQANYVDGITGATITSDGIDEFLERDLKAYEPLSQRLRRDQAL